MGMRFGKGESLENAGWTGATAWLGLALMVDLLVVLFDYFWHCYLGFCGLFEEVWGTVSFAHYFTTISAYNHSRLITYNFALRSIIKVYHIIFIHAGMVESFAWVVGEIVGTAGWDTLATISYHYLLFLLNFLANIRYLNIVFADYGFTLSPLRVLFSRITLISRFRKLQHFAFKFDTLIWNSGRIFR